MSATCGRCIAASSALIAVVRLKADPTTLTSQADYVFLYAESPGRAIPLIWIPRPSGSCTWKLT